MSLGIYAPWARVSPWSGTSAALTATYADAQAAIAGGASPATTWIVVLVPCNYDQASTEPTVTVTYGNVSGTARSINAGWTGVAGWFVHYLAAVIPLLGYNGASNQLGFGFTGSTNIPSHLTDSTLGAFAVTVTGVSAGVNASALSSMQIWPETALLSAPAVTINFSTNPGDLLLGVGFLNITGGGIQGLFPTGHVDSAQVPASTAPGSHNSGAMIATYGFATGSSTPLSFGNYNAAILGVSGSGGRVSFGGFVLSEVQITGGNVYGKFADTKAFAPVVTANLGNAKPRIWQPLENLTMKVPIK